MENNITKEVRIVGELFQQLFTKFNKMENKKKLYKDFDEITLAEINTILVVGRSENIRMSEIANSLGVTFGTPTITVNRLINKGYIKRTINDEDKREVFISLSDKGVEVFRTIVDLRLKLTEKIFGILTLEEQQYTIKLLSKLNDMFDLIVKYY